MVDVLPGSATGGSGVEVGRVVPGRVVDPTTGMTRHERARYEREVAVLDLTDAAQALARCTRVAADQPSEPAQFDLAGTLYASADQHRRRAELLDLQDGEPAACENAR